MQHLSMCRSIVSSTTSIITVICTLKNTKYLFDSLQQIRSDTGLWHDGDRTPIYTSFRCDLRCLSAVLLEEYPRSIVCSTALKMESLMSFSLRSSKYSLIRGMYRNSAGSWPPFLQNEPSATPEKRKTHTFPYHICSITASDLLYKNVTVAPATQDIAKKWEGYTSDR